MKIGKKETVFSDSLFFIHTILICTANIIEAIIS
jgi:hypothetical protein